MADDPNIHVADQAVDQTFGAARSSTEAARAALSQTTAQHGLAGQQALRSYFDSLATDQRAGGRAAVGDMSSRTRNGVASALASQLATTAATGYNRGLQRLESEQGRHSRGMGAISSAGDQYLGGLADVTGAFGEQQKARVQQAIASEIAKSSKAKQASYEDMRVQSQSKAAAIKQQFYEQVDKEYQAATTPQDRAVAAIKKAKLDGMSDTEWVMSAADSLGFTDENGNQVTGAGLFGPYTPSPDDQRRKDIANAQAAQIRSDAMQGVRADFGQMHKDIQDRYGAVIKAQQSQKNAQQQAVAAEGAEKLRFAKLSGYLGAGARDEAIRSLVKQAVANDPSIRVPGGMYQQIAKQYPVIREGDAAALTKIYGPMVQSSPALMAARRDATRPSAVGAPSTALQAAQDEVARNRSKRDAERMAAIDELYRRGATPSPSTVAAVAQATNRSEADVAKSLGMDPDADNPQAKDIRGTESYQQAEDNLSQLGADMMAFNDSEENGVSFLQVVDVLGDEEQMKERGLLPMDSRTARQFIRDYPELFPFLKSSYDPSANAYVQGN